MADVNAKVLAPDSYEKAMELYKDAGDTLAKGKDMNSVKEDLNERAGAVSRSVREAADTLKNEIKDAGTETFDRVKQAGVDAAEAAGQKVKT